MPPASRAEYLASLNSTWEHEARAEIMKWHSAFDDAQTEYFYHIDSKAVMWERPVDALLPAFYLKKEFLKHLTSAFSSGHSVRRHKASPTRLRSKPSPASQVPDESWQHYLTSQEVITAQEEDLLAVFQAVLTGAPLPAPWTMWFDKLSKTFFFTNSSTLETKWSHPLHHLLVELADVGRRVQVLPAAIKAEHLAALNRTWETEARAEILKWQTAMDNGREYYYNVDTKEAMWERPVDAVLPAFFLKKQFLKKLSLRHESKPSDRMIRDLAECRLQRKDSASSTTASWSAFSDNNSEDRVRRRRASQKLSEIAHLDDNWEYYLTTQGIVNIPGEENLLHSFQSVLKRAPLPAPWKIWHDKANNRFFFVKKTTGRGRCGTSHGQHYQKLPTSRQKWLVKGWKRVDLV